MLRDSIPPQSQIPPHSLRNLLDLLLAQRPPRGLQMQFHTGSQHDPLPDSAIGRRGIRSLTFPSSDDLNPLK